MTDQRKKLHMLIIEEKHKEAYDLLCEMDSPRAPIVIEIFQHEVKHNLIEASEPILTTLLHDGQYEVSREDLKDIDKERICRTTIVANAIMYYLEAMSLDMQDAGQFQARMNEIEMNSRYAHDIAETEKSMMGVI